MAFKPKYEVPTHQLRRAVIGNSAVMTVGVALQPGATSHNQFVVVSGTSNPVLGVCLAIEGNRGRVLELNAKTVASDNETVGLIQAVYIPSYLYVDFVADMSAATGTTTDSGGMGWFNCASGGLTLTESGVALFGGTQGQFWSYGYVNQDPTSNTSKVVGHWSKIL